MTLGLCDEVSVGLWVISCWNCYVEGAVVRAMMLGAAMFGCGVEDYCV